jgi:hypothetical protein
VREVRWRIYPFAAQGSETIRRADMVCTDEFRS